MRYRQLRSAGSTVVGKPCTEGLEKHNIRTPAHGSPARPVRYVFSATKYSQILSRHDGNDVRGLFFGEEGYGRIIGGTRVLEQAADCSEAALGHGAR
jgi:hypothetical protein